MISLFFIEFIRVGGGERFRIDDSLSLDFIYDTASFKDKGVCFKLDLRYLPAF